MRYGGYDMMDTIRWIRYGGYDTVDAIHFGVSFWTALVTLFTEGSDLGVWKIKPNIALVSIVCSGLFGSCINNTIHTWALRIKGPLFVAMFKPLSIAIAVAMGVIFLRDSLYIGSLIGQR
ncbi:WAT1-related protein At3g28050 [Capsella rubella]|uniref:WAT1-related protein At3g28050 n=1 Tax=Capsella rubella TaxID=81985 RepID=UPI000CD58EC8|nr:WAT1-related protein At3g28050 [Capsella rubella]